LSSKEIAQRLDKSERTIRRELKRGLTTILNTYLEEIEVYSADIANDKYLFNLKAKGKNLKIGSDIELVRRIERMTREEIIIKIKGKNNEYVVKAINGLERKYGKSFYSKFKTITFDNGVEFMDYKGIEQSYLKKGKRTEVYYAHPYCSGERGSNENNNRMIRRWIPKGTIIDNITTKHIKEIENWLNNYQRAMFDYKSSNMLLYKYIKNLHFR